MAKGLRHDLGVLIVQRGPERQQVRVFLGRDWDGKRRYHCRTFTGKDGKKEARKCLIKVLRERDLATLVEPAMMSLDE